MPRYFFDLSDGTHERDEVGTPFSGDREAELEAVRFLGDILKHEPQRLREDTLSVDVRSHDRTLQFRVVATLKDNDPR